MKVLSLFSGIGGFDLAAQRQGHEIIGACEIDKHARSVYRQHFPNVPVWEDATKIDPKELPDFEMLCAGFPCQAFSLAGKRLGLEDTRGTLFYEIARIAREKRPGVILLENVKGLLYHDDGRTLTTIIETFYELGYDLEWQVINGKYFLPQNRERIFIIGHLRGKPTRKIFPIRENDELSYDREKESGTNIRCLTGGGHLGGLHSQMTVIPVLSINRKNRRQNGRRFKGDGDPSFTLTTQDQHGILYDIKSDSQANRVYNTKGISPTLGSGHAMSQPLINKSRIRRLTPIECERLQGFPDGWTSGISDTQRYKCIGNAVMVPVVERILQEL